MRFYPPKTTTIIREANTLESGELVYDIDTQKLYIGDGTTLGGIEVGNASNNIQIFDNAPTEVTVTTGTLAAGASEIVNLPYPRVCVLSDLTADVNCTVEFYSRYSTELDNNLLQSYTLTANTLQETNLLTFNEDPSDSYLKAQITNTSASPAAITLTTEIIPVFSPTGMVWKIITGNTNAEVETGYHVDTNVNSTITLPLNPSIGNEVAIKLINSGGATIIVDKNSNKINGFESNFSITKLYKTYRFIFSSLEKGWICEEADYINVLTDGANIPIDASISDTFEITLGGNRILDNPTNTYEGQEITIYIIQDGTGSRTLSYGTNYKFPGGTIPTLSTIGGSIDKLECRVRNGNLLCDFTSNYS